MKYSEESSAVTKKFWRLEIKKRAIKAFGEKCSYCQQEFHPVVFDLHHLIQEEKEFNISSSYTNGAKSWIKIRDELRKCCLLCSNCHRLLHSGLIEILNPIPFNEEHYEWDLTNCKQINHITMESKDSEKDKYSVCLQCGANKPNTYRKLCVKCGHSGQQIVERPDRDSLKEMIYELPFTEIAKIYGVSDNAIRKWCDTMKLPRLKRDINSYSQKEWEDI